MDWLLTHHRGLIDAGFALNEGGGGVVKRRPRLSHNVQASEKNYLSFELQVTNSGGHSSVPRADNAITQLASAMTRIAELPFAGRAERGDEGVLHATAGSRTPPVAAAMGRSVANPNDAAVARAAPRCPRFNSQLRTSCVVTMLEGGHARTRCRSGRGPR